MKEFASQTGGRYTYVDDIMNLQDLALAISQMFDGCDNFVLSGCNVSGSAISAGYVYINGKLRYFSGATGITSWPQYIYERNNTESVPYASGADKVGRNIYSCAIGKVVPTTLDPLTGKAPSALLVRDTGAVTFREAFIGKYALLLNGNGQSVAGKVAMADLTAKSVVAESAGVKLGNSVHRQYYNGGALIYESTNGGASYKMTIEDGIGFRFYVNGNLIATLGENGIQFNKNVSTAAGDNTSTVGSVTIAGNAIFNSTTAGNDGVLNLNVTGHNGNTTYARTTNIGNGKGKTLFSVDGRTEQITGSGFLVLSSAYADGVVLKAAVPRTNVSLLKNIAWKDSNNDTIAYAGYRSASNHVFSIHNELAGVSITGVGYVDLGPAIKENGVFLEDKYVTKTGLDALITGKADKSDTYTKAETTDKFAALELGLSQYFNAGHTKATLRNELEAASSSDVAACAVKSKFLSDMATTEANKKAIRDNIGAAAVGDYQTKLRDTGWLKCSGQEGLYARQIGNVVSIQGRVRTIHSGTVFSVPNTIDAPTHEVYQSISFSNSTNWTCEIQANTRACKTVYCMGGCYEYSSFSMTYMV